MYKILIVDDEFLARKLLEGYISMIPDLELVGTAHNGSEAIEICKSKQVDIVLLDINMPDWSGLEVARFLESVPAKIFTTAYSEYALQSYEVNAVDYLLKPIDHERFRVAIEKAKFAVDAIKGVINAADAQNILTIRADGMTYRILPKDIIYIEGQHEYVTFHTCQQRITALYALKNLESELADQGFIRIHKSFIVNLNYVVKANSNLITLARYPHSFNPDFADTHFTLPIGGSYRDAIRARLK